MSINQYYVNQLKHAHRLDSCTLCLVYLCFLESRVSTRGKKVNLPDTAIWSRIPVLQRTTFSITLFQTERG